MALFEFLEKPTGDEQQKVHNLCAMRKTAEALRIAHEPVWLTNFGFFAGRQWDAYTNDVWRFRRVEVAPPAASKTKLTDNRILVLFRHFQATVLANASTHTAVAATPDEADRMAAELATRWIPSFEAMNKEREKRWYEWQWKMLTGLVGRMSAWNPDAPGLGIDLQPMPGAGEVESKTYNPFQLLFSPYRSSEDTIPWFIISEVRPVDEVNSWFDGTKSKTRVQSESDAAAMAGLDRLLGGVAFGKEIGIEKRKDSVIVNWCYHEPTHDRPNGGMWQFTNEHLLGEGDLPDEFMPLVVKHLYPIAGAVYGHSYVGPLIDPQRELNTIKSQLAALRNKQLVPPLITDGPGNATQDWVRDAEGEKTDQKIIRMPMGGQKWDYLHYDHDTAEANKQQQTNWEDMKMSGLMRDQDLGVAGATQTAREALLLQEKTAMGISIFREMDDWDNAHILEQCLQIVKENYVIPRALKMVGADMVQNIEAFMGADFLDTTDVRPKPTPMITEQMKAAMIADYAKEGVYSAAGDPVTLADHTAILMASGLPDIKEQWESFIGMTVEQIYEEGMRFRAKSNAALEMQIDAVLQQSQAPAEEEGMAGALTGAV